MPTINNGESQTLTMSAYDMLTVMVRDSAVANVECPIGSAPAQFESVRSFGPLTQGCDVKITSITGSFSYEIANLETEQERYMITFGSVSPPPQIPLTEPGDVHINDVTGDVYQAVAL